MCVLQDAHGEMKPHVQELNQKATHLIGTCYFTDAVLLFTPAQIALAALRMASMGSAYASTVNQFISSYVRGQVSNQAQHDSVLVSASPLRQPAVCS